jgi:hypothetical protein
MGTDIEFHVEQRGPAGWHRVQSERSWYDRRDSDLFRLLRHWPDGLGCRGLPDDVSDEVRRDAGDFHCEHADSYWDRGLVHVKADPPCGCLAGGGHACLTVRQLVAYDWTQTKEQFADVADRDDDAFRQGGRAAHLEEIVNSAGTAILEPWSSWTDDPGAVPEHTAIDALRSGCRTDGNRVLITWQQPVWRDVNGYWFAAVLRMAHLAGDDLDSVRCVFWFS